MKRILVLATLVLLLVVPAPAAASTFNVTLVAPPPNGNLTGTYSTNVTSNASIDNVTIQYFNTTAWVNVTTNETNGTGWITGMDTTTIPDGSYPFRAMGKNGSEVQYSTNSSNITVDNTAPSISATPLSGGRTGTSISLNVDVTEAHIRSCEYKIDSGSYTSLSAPTYVKSISMTSWAYNVNHTITVRCTDTFNLTTTLTRNYYRKSTSTPLASSTYTTSSLLRAYPDATGITIVKDTEDYVIYRFKNPRWSFLWFNLGEVTKELTFWKDDGYKSVRTVETSWWSWLPFVD